MTITQARKSIRELTPLTIAVVTGIILFVLMGLAAQSRWCGPDLCQSPAVEAQR